MTKAILFLTNYLSVEKHTFKKHINLE